MYRVIHCLTFCLKAALLVLVGVETAAATTSYHIGNSLTNDSQPEALEVFAANRGFDHEVGFHIRSSSSLGNILANPTDVSVEPNEFGTFSEALPNNAWDIVTIQPHPNGSPRTTLGEDLNSILSFIDLTRTNPANQNTNFYIYQGWPQLVSSPYQTQWTLPSPDSLDAQMHRRREYYDNLIDHVRAETDANVYMIPVGEVLFELDVRMRAGEIPGLSSVNQLYRDSIHLSYGIGRFVASATTFATVMGQYPTELEVPYGFFGGSGIMNAAQKEAILETIRDVLDKHAYSGVTMPASLRADFDGNLIVDDMDLDLWEASQGLSNQYDMNEDGSVTGRDFLKWQREYHSSLNEEDLANFIYADINKDGVFNAADLEHWQANYGLGNGGDVDGDGDTDGRDFLAWQRAIPANPADTNRDFLINHVELQGWQETYGYVPSTDANGDGLVDLADFEIWQEENGQTWNFPYAQSAPPLPSLSSISQVGISVVVPEPAAVVMICSIMFILGIRATVRGLC